MLSSQISRVTDPLQQMQQLKERSDGFTKLLSAEFPPPTLPATAPVWLKELAADPAWQYKDVTTVFPVESHLLYHGLKRDDGIREFYHFLMRQPPPSSPSASSPSSPSPSPSPPELIVVFYLGPALCGHTGIVHGGLTASLIDQISGETAFIVSGPGAFTANLNVNYTKPLIANRYVRVHGRVLRTEGRKVWVEVRVSDGEAEEGGVEYANGNVLFVRPKWIPQGDKEWAINADRVKSEEDKASANGNMLRSA
jgi:uncharacterized protein (TIGR00369 family)